ncbi:DUF4236 domain-containing protein [Sporosarcina sp. 179-K 3D1 HS]|uniref:DUF4236 domain-containing protein n=1 Tax=Sporosarcina sp. 179-K 3D1 HS TaxID=3232169 RepID=UPI0039A392D1
MMKLAIIIEGNIAKDGVIGLALRMRKSFTITKGVRMTVSKTGVGVSIGTRGLRHSIHSSGRRTSTIGIPGSGISYVKTSSGKKKRTTSNSAIERQLQKQREIDGNTQIVEEYEALREQIISVHKESEAVIDWAAILDIAPPFVPPQPGPETMQAREKYESYVPGFFQKLLKSADDKKRSQLKEQIVEAEKRDAAAYEEWRELNDLARRVLEGELDAYFEVMDELKPFDDLLDYGSGFEVGTDDPGVMEVEFKVKSSTVVPDYVVSLTKTGKLSQKQMTKTMYYDLLQDYVCSCIIRIARDLLAILPVNRVIIHAVDERINTASGHMEEVTICSALLDREGMNRLNFDRIDPSDALENFRCNMKHMKTSGFREVERITEW